MKKLIRIRIVAMLCLFFRRQWRLRQDQRRKLILRTAHSRLNLQMTRFFRHHPPETIRYYTLIIFQCWSINDCTLKTKVADRDFADFLDQLNDFSAAAYRYHQSRTGSAAGRALP